MIRNKILVCGAVATDINGTTIFITEIEVAKRIYSALPHFLACHNYIILESLFYIVLKRK